MMMTLVQSPCPILPNVSQAVRDGRTCQKGTFENILDSCEVMQSTIVQLSPKLQMSKPRSSTQCTVVERPDHHGGDDLVIKRQHCASFVVFLRVRFRSGVPGDLYYCRNGAINDYALSFNMQVKNEITEIYFNWQNEPPLGLDRPDVAVRRTSPIIARTSPKQLSRNNCQRWQLLFASLLLCPVV